MALGITSDPAPLFDKITLALTIIRHHDPRRAGRVRKYLKRILIVPRGAEVYDHGIRSYLASAELLLARPIEAVALALIHESTHGWLSTKGVVNTPARLDRIERLCIAQEIAFANRLPDASQWVAFAEEKLTRPWWGSQEGQQRLDALASDFRVPRWLRDLRRRLFGRQPP